MDCFMAKLVVLIFSAWTVVLGYPQSGDIDVLTKMNYDFITSLKTKDTATLARIFADDMILISPGGTKMTKEEMLSNAVHQDISAVHIDSADVRLLTPDVGLVTAYLTFSVSSGNEQVKGRNCYQDVYVKRKNRWYAVAAHVTLLR
jgi:uncharacterized protein (TIGR02246 family)